MDVDKSFSSSAPLAEVSPILLNDYEAHLLVNKKIMIFICAWNEEDSLPQVISDLQVEIPDADILVIDDGSVDRTADRARQGGVEVFSFPNNQGLPIAIAEGYSQAFARKYDICGRVDADGQHQAFDLKNLINSVAADQCDVAIGSRFLSDSLSYQPKPERLVGTALLRFFIKMRLGQPISDGTSGLYAVNRFAMRLLAIPYDVGSPEVQGLIRLSDAELIIKEIPANMKERETGSSSFRGKRAFHLVLTVAAILMVGEGARRRKRSRN